MNVGLGDIDSVPSRSGNTQCVFILSRNFPLVTRSPGTPSTTASISVPGIATRSILTRLWEKGCEIAPMEE